MKKQPPAHSAFVALAVAYVALAAGYQRAVPLFEAPDEPSHIHYVAFVSTANRLPLYGTTPDVPGEGMQPPLYYLLSVPLFRALVDDPSDLIRDLRQVNLRLYTQIRTRPRPGQLIRHPPLRGIRQFRQSPSLAYLLDLRWPSLVFGLLAVTLTYVAILRAFSDPPLAVLSAGILALNPQFLFTSGYVSNDTAAVAVGALMLWLTVTALRDPAGAGRRHYVYTAVAAALALLTKNSLLPGLAIAGLVIFLADHRSMRRRLADSLWALCVLVILIGPYLVWNLLHRGDLLGMDAVWQSASRMLGNEAYGGAWSYFTGMYWVWTFESYWGRFGWLNVLAPTAVYFAYLFLTAAGSLGFVVAGRGVTSTPTSIQPRWFAFPGNLRLYLAGAALITLAAHLWLNVQTAQPQGRHLFPVAPQIASLLAIGIAHLAHGTRNSVAESQIRIGGWQCAAVLLALAGLAVYCCVGVIVPAYR